MSDGLFLLLLMSVGFAVRQLTLALPIPEDLVRRYVEQQQRERVPGPTHYSPTDDEDWPSQRSNSFDSGYDWSDDDGVNIDGTPMMGDVDIHGNPFGVTDDW